MKRQLFANMVLGMLLASCTLETSDNGDLDGFWQLTQLDTLATGGTTDMHERNMFWAVQMHMLEIKSPTGNSFHNVLFRFEHQGDSLIISSPRYNNREESDPEIIDLTELEQYGICHLREAFFVARLNSSNMDLKSDRFRFRFRKY